MNKAFILILLFFIKAEAQESISALAIGDSLYTLGDYSKAMNYYRQLPEGEQIQFKIAKSYEALGNNPKAIQYYNNVIVNNPKAIQAKYAFGRLLFKTAKFQVADSIFENLSFENPSNPNYVYQRGLIKEKQQDSSAILFFQKTYILDSNHINAIYKIAKLKLEKRQFVESEIFIKKGLYIDSLSIRFLTLKALKHYHNKEYHKSIEVYEKLLRLGKNSERLHYNLANSYSQVLKIEEATKQYILLINGYDDKNSDYHYLLGLSFRALHYNEKAKRQLELAIALKFTSLDVEYLTLAMLYKRERNFKKTLEYLELALMDNSNNELASYQLAVASDNYFKDKKTVIRYYEKYLKKFGETGRMRNMVKARISDLKKEVHFKD